MYNNNATIVHKFYHLRPSTKKVLFRANHDADIHKYRWSITPDKDNILAESCETSEYELLCLQDTHRETNHRRPNISGMRQVLERPHSKYEKCLVY